MTVDEVLKKQRAYSGLSQAALSEKSGISAVMVSSYESAKRVPKIEHRKMLADAMGTDPVELIMPDMTALDLKRLLIRALINEAALESPDPENGKIRFSIDKKDLPDLSFISYIEGLKRKARTETEKAIMKAYIDFLICTYPKYADEAMWPRAQEDFKTYLKKHGSR